MNDGRVYDVLNVGIGGIRTGIFNVADMILMFAMAYLVFVTGDAKTPARRIP